MPRTRPRLGVFKFSSCDGCQLSLLDCEDELLAVAGAIDIAYFPEAMRSPDRGRYDLALVEGSVSTERELREILSIRRRARRLVTIGACASSGGIQALRNLGDLDEFKSVVYARPEYVSALAHATPISEHVPVDFELRGCPISKQQLIEVVSAQLAGRRPVTPTHSTCIECKLAGHVCVTVARGLPCLGPVTHAGCGALCPGYDRGCYGCFGPVENANTGALAARMRALGSDRPSIRRMFTTFNVNAPEFAREARAHED